MLTELRIQNLLLIERAELCLSPGLNVITGETGAGKTMLAHALDLLLGGKARPQIVRPGTDEAYVEGVFAWPQASQPEWLDERLAVATAELTLARRVLANGRTRAYINGRSASVGELRQVAERLIGFYGQHEHRKLKLTSTQLEILDDFCGSEHAQQRSEYATTYQTVSELQAQLTALEQHANDQLREQDLLAFELQEIEQLQPSQTELDDLRAERERLRNCEALRTAAQVGAAAITLAEDSDEGGGARGGLAQAASGLAALRGLDQQLDRLDQRYQALCYEAEDLASELRAYQEQLEVPPGRLEQVEERLAEFERLERKHGGSVAAVLAYADRCRARLTQFSDATAASEAITEQLQVATERLTQLATQLHNTRVAAAEHLTVAVEERLGQLAMAGASLQIAIEQRPQPGPTGSDTVEFLLATNPGVPAGPLREIASGGELSRVMLALTAVAADGLAQATPGANSPAPATPDSERVGLLVFDEIDAGVGGQTARNVGEQLAALAATRQVLCITHLPQIASLAQRHFRIAKETEAALARTTVTRLDQAQLIDELTRMLGAGEHDRAAREHAQELLKAIA